MKSFYKIIITLILLPSLLIGCNDMLDVNSESVAFTDEYTLTASNDTLYSMFAVFSKLSKLADRYVILGELRGDLMNLKEDGSDKYLKEINNFDISSDNPYARKSDYYAVINNCNYIISRIDTSVEKNAEKVMLRCYAACKAIRAWTYMQLVQNYGSAIYYDKPILSIEDAEKIQAQTPVSLEELTPVLIADLEPYKDVATPSLGYLYNFNTNKAYFPIRFILGDLYLWNGQYEKAAKEYYDLINSQTYLINYFTAAFKVTNNAFENIISFSAYGHFGIFLTSYQNLEQISNIGATNQYGQTFHMDSLTYNRTLYPSAIALNNWDKQMYYYSTILHKSGDLRKWGAVTTSFQINNSPIYNYADSTSTLENYSIYKYIAMNPIKDDRFTEKRIGVYRVALLYLRYAEALNRMGKPNTAFAILKNGLNKVNMNSTSVIPHKELNMNISESGDTTYSVPSYMNFTDSKFDNNIGIRMRSLGNVNLDRKFYIIPELPSQADSIRYVEDMIIEEAALETAFEGNRFNDLMRIAIRRNDNSYLANKVAKKYASDAENIRNKLLIRSNWYIR